MPDQSWKTQASIMLPRNMNPATVRHLVACLRAMDIRPIVCYGDTDAACVDTVPMEHCDAVAQAVADILA